jgi:glutamyl-tRNA(Gln) amidotransferase subunit E
MTELHTLGGNKLEYDKLQMKCGIEIHQEIATSHKLFCKCPPKLSDKSVEWTFTRRLRPSQSELGEIDPAALFEFKKGKIIQYEADSDTTCLVEMDEEPPGPMNNEALDITLTFALMVGSNPVDEVWVMRKTVVDGSNTGGFQRTSVVTLGGAIMVNGKSYRLNQICLEEDAARNLREEGDVITYSLDRLGIPLMEITTAPDMSTPLEVKEVAQRIGSILRSTGKVRRGLGTIRQDLNVSIMNGPVVEIKGVQALEMIPTIVEYEVKRQATLLEIAIELKKRGATLEKQRNIQFNVSGLFQQTECKILRSALKAGGVVLAVVLPGFLGLTGHELCQGRRLGTEMSDHAKQRGGVKGIFHTDELPGFNITIEEVTALRTKVGAAENDAVIIVADKLEKCKLALDAVIERAQSAFYGVTLETRSANQDGTTRFTRPRPGAARMYPETDVKAITITSERISELKRVLPEMPEHKLERFMTDYNLNEKLARQIVDSEYMILFEEMSRKYPHITTLSAVTLTEDMKKLQRDSVAIENLSDEILGEVFRLVAEGLTLKESIPAILTWLTINQGKPATEALQALTLEMMTEIELEVMIEKKIKANTNLVTRMGDKAAAPLMGIVMSEVRGRAKAPDVQFIIERMLKEYKS